MWREFYWLCAHHINVMILPWSKCIVCEYHYMNVLHTQSYSTGSITSSICMYTDRQAVSLHCYVTWRRCIVCEYHYIQMIHTQWMMTGSITTSIRMYTDAYAVPLRWCDLHTMNTTCYVMTLPISYISWMIVGTILTVLWLTHNEYFTVCHDTAHHLQCCASHTINITMHDDRQYDYMHEIHAQWISFTPRITEWMW